MPDNNPQPPDDDRVEGERGSRRGRSYKPSGTRTTKNLNMDDIDMLEVGGGEDVEDVTLDKMQAMEVDSTQRQLATLRKTHDEHRSGRGQVTTAETD